MDAFECETVLVHSINMLAASRVQMEKYGIRTFSDLRAYVAGHPGEVSVAMQSAIGVDGMCFEIATKGLALNPVDYQSGTDVNSDLANGLIDLAVGGYDDMSSQIDAGNVVPLLLFCEHRVSILPDCECTAELGIDSYAGPWRAIFAKKGTPQGAIDAIVEAVEACRGDATWQGFVMNASYDQREIPSPGAETQKFCLNEYESIRDYLHGKNSPEKAEDGPNGSEAAQGSGEAVRVGWYESPFNETDQFGRRSGYAYEYQQKIAAYTGWRYEYVKGSWPELLQMLIDGEIDLMGDVSYTVSRARNMLYSMFPMGAEEYYIFISTESDSGVSADDYASLNGKKLGVNRASVQADMLRSWVAQKGVQAEILELTADEKESVEMLRRGEIDALVTIDGYGSADHLVPLFKIGSSDIYFAVSKTRPELIQALDSAMLRIQAENSYYVQHLTEKYIHYSGTNRFLSESELNWLAEHGSIRIGYRDNYLAFCARDKSTGELTGALREFIAMASNRVQNAEITFEAVAFPSSADALEALKRGEIDCVFPVNISICDAEEADVLTTASLMQCEMYAVVRSAALRDFTMDGAVAVAVNEGNPSYETFLMDHFPNWKRVYFQDTEACLKAVSDGKADCMLVGNYRINSIAGWLDEYKLTTVTTGVAMDSFFAINRQDSDLYAILNKTINLVPASAVNAALASYSYEERQITLAEFIRENVLAELAAVGVILALILTFLLRSMRSERKTREAMDRIADLNEEQKKQLDEIAMLNTRLSDNQERLKEALAASEQASRAKTSFLSNMSHEIRTPMNAIIGLDNIALRDPELPANTRDQLEKIGASARHLLGIINDILDMSRIESGRMALKNEEFSFRDFLDQINVMINGQCVDKGLHYECNIIGYAEDYCIGDDMKL